MQHILEDKSSAIKLRVIFPVSVFVENGSSEVHDYDTVVSYYGATTLNDLRNKLGNKDFYKAMYIYYEKEISFALWTNQPVKISRSFSKTNMYI